MPERVGSSEGLGLDDERLRMRLMMPWVDPLVKTLGLEPLKGADVDQARTNALNSPAR